mmetsp:Transcript_8256/g.21097  ORF Transcript_8256/g.21097 Transcript_8256/m.21097 type:complete len:264 (-) Transcript_8256:177-968(-)
MRERGTWQPHRAPARSQASCMLIWPLQCSHAAMSWATGCSVCAGDCSRMVYEGLCRCSARVIRRASAAALNWMERLQYFGSFSSETLCSCLGSSSVSTLVSTRWLASASISLMPIFPVTAMMLGNTGSTTPCGQRTAYPGDILLAAEKSTTLLDAPTGFVAAFGGAEGGTLAAGLRLGLGSDAGAACSAASSERGVDATATFSAAPRAGSYRRPSAGCTVLLSAAKPGRTRIGFISCASSSCARNCASFLRRRSLDLGYVFCA